MFSMSASSLSGLPHTIASLPRKCLVCDAPWDELHLSVDDTAGRKLEKLQDPFGTNIIQYQ